MTISIGHRPAAGRGAPDPNNAATPSRLPQWLEFAAFVLALLVLTGLAMVFRFQVYGPGDVWSRLGQIFG